MTRKVLNGLDLGNQRIVALGDPSAGTDAATKQYVDQVARGLNWKQAVRAASTANATLASAYENGDVVDGVTLATGDRILIKNQTTASENGIYIVAASGAPARAADMPAGSDGKGVAVTVTSGTVNADKVYIQTADTATVGTDALAWSQLGGGGTAYVAGDGLTESPAGTFNVNAGAGLEVSSDAVRIAAAAAGAGLTGGGGSALAVGAGTGISVAADAVAVDTGVVSRHVAANVGDGVATQIDITHNLGTFDVCVEVFVNSGSRETVLPDVSRVDVNTVRLNFATAPTSGQYRAVIQG
ncbi:hypothetical protein ACIBG7_43325 [Nonomuraea sp. NPDC050328]|uniref:hypothetical protein n=1 Tax=Nonomuraea sp. NPDC050328 TaxID=3364361 RepID=UPI00379B0918